MQMVINWSEDKIQKIKGIGVILIPVALFFIPLGWLQHQHTICIFKNITGHDCYGCGMTRAILSSLHLRFIDAYHYNKLVFVVLPLLVFIWLKLLINCINKVSLQANSYSVNCNNKSEVKRKKKHRY